MYGDILSDVAAQIAGSVGLAGSANIGEEFAMFEAIHGSAPRRAGQDLANPSGLLQGAVLMLNHIGQNEVAEKIQNAWLKTLEDGVHTYDIFKEGTSKTKVSTSEFAEAIIKNLGKIPTTLKPANYANSKPIDLKPYKRKPAATKVLKGVDVFLHWNGLNVDELGEIINTLKTENLSLNMISNRGIKVWPEGLKQTFCTDHWRCRFIAKNGSIPLSTEIIKIQDLALQKGFDVIKTENLYEFNGKAGYSLGQGQ